MGDFFPAGHKVRYRKETEPKELEPSHLGVINAHADGSKWVDIISDETGKHDWAFTDGVILLDVVPKQQKLETSDIKPEPFEIKTQADWRRLRELQKKLQKR